MQNFPKFLIISIIILILSITSTAFAHSNQLATKYQQQYNERPALRVLEGATDIVIGSSRFVIQTTARVAKGVVHVSRNIVKRILCPFCGKIECKKCNRKARRRTHQEIHRQVHTHIDHQQIHPRAYPRYPGIYNRNHIRGRYIPGNVHLDICLNPYIYPHTRQYPYQYRHPHSHLHIRPYPGLYPGLYLNGSIGSFGGSIIIN